VVQRYVNPTGTTTTTSTTSTYFLQLELNGLTSVGTNPLDQLRRNIPGYQSLAPPGRVIGPYEDYE
jgi:LPS-assembly protein